MTPLSNEAQQARTGILVATGLLLLVFGFAILLALPDIVLHSNPVWFIGLLIIFGASLALIAVVFRWLGLQAPGEAFGLPSGSIRTLLAVGVMVLFAVFGLAAISTDEGWKGPADEPLKTTAVVTGDAAAVQAEIKRYKALNIAAVPASGSASGAELKLYPMKSFKSQEAIDLQKQIITALVTLLTAVVSFYFGSRSAEAALGSKDKGKPKDAAGDANAGTDPKPGTTPVDLKALDASIAASATRLAALQSDTAPPGNAATLATALEGLSAEMQGVRDDRTKLDAALADAATNNTPPPAVAATALGERVDALDQRLAVAEALVAKG